MEANLAMERANVETTHEFVGLSACKGSGTGLREVDLNENPVLQNQRWRPMEVGNKMVCLNDTNYNIWRSRMKDLLFVKTMHLPVFALQKPKSKSEEEWALEHKQVCSYIRQFVDDNVYNHIRNETNAKILWQKLETLYTSKTSFNKLYYLMKLMQVKYKEGMSMVDHLNEFQGCVNQLSSMGFNFDNELLGLWLLTTLPDSWEKIRFNIANTAPNGVVTLKIAKKAMLNEEMKRRSRGSSSSHSEMLIFKSRARKKGHGPKSSEKSQNKSRPSY